jgi:hypothetical protein
MSSSAAIQMSAIQKVSNDIEAAARECGVEAIANLPTFMQAIQMAQGIAALRTALTDAFMLQAIMPLQGSKLGFLTDKDKDGGYGLHVVREVCIEAILRGFRCVGNEFNIIGGGFYGAKAGFHRKVQEFPALTDLVLEPGVPHLSQDKGGALVSFSAGWRFKGQPMRIDCQYRKDGENVMDNRIPVRVNAGMGADGILGKAERKILARIYGRMMGGAFSVPEGEVGEEPILTTGEPAPSPIPEGTPEGKRVPVVRLSGKRGPAPEGAKAEPAPAAPAAESKPEAKSETKASEKTSDGAIPISRPRRQPQETPLSWAMVHAALSLADPAWEAGDHLTTIMGWSSEQMRAAYTWAQLFDDKDIDDAKLPPRPAFTVLSRQPGED